ncbi:YvcK family protein [Candidatus Oleimmundimicrobium sp.]|uniref:gluconeogenesis factor YvcK family protein n=1 Tax=Candidatus Oleimmundimicrobium sp. TaxID=3060597 RepID=UPI0027197E43|nr:YvcK family protein [Candidatus Oleimmundimicrobium sp.]MDO8885711.1 YvcK family protein [Candidatus Oleimmundimicrobium sp.]
MICSKKEKGISVVAIGGGTGLPNILKSLKIYANDITAIVTVADDGGSSGRIRKELGILPPGDIRNCLMALSNSNSIVGDIFQYRFKKGELAGHSLGNLILAALTDMKGDFVEAIRESGNLLKIEGRVLPSSTEDIVLFAKTKNGGLIEGQSRITEPKNWGGIKNVRIKPEEAEAYPEAVKAIEAADQIILGPGSLFTSIIPNLLVKGIKDALFNSKAMKVFICNITTQPGETDNYSAADHLEAVSRHVSKNFVNTMVINSNFDGLIEHELAPVKIDEKRVFELGTKPLLEDVADTSFVGHHDSYKLSQVLRALI